MKNKLDGLLRLDILLVAMNQEKINYRSGNF